MSSNRINAELENKNSEPSHSELQRLANNNTFYNSLNSFLYSFDDGSSFEPRVENNTANKRINHYFLDDVQLMLFIIAAAEVLRPFYPENEPLNLKMYVNEVRTNEIDPLNNERIKVKLPYTQLDYQQTSCLFAKTASNFLSSYADTMERQREEKAAEEKASTLLTRNGRA